jgi:hypothetical protein
MDGYSGADVVGALRDATVGAIADFMKTQSDAEGPVLMKRHIEEAIELKRVRSSS